MISSSRGKVSKAELVFCCAVTNSYAFDFLVRQRTSTTISMFTFYQLPVPRLTEKDAGFAAIVRRAARLMCTTPEFDDLTKEVGAALHVPRSELKGATAPAERAKLRAELDGLIAHLYELTEEEFAHILSTFPLVSDAAKAAAQSAYRDAANGLIE